MSRESPDGHRCISRVTIVAKNCRELRGFCSRQCLQSMVAPEGLDLTEKEWPPARVQG
jgi:hypothetical protein